MPPAVTDITLLSTVVRSNFQEPLVLGISYLLVLPLVLFQTIQPLNIIVHLLLNLPGWELGVDLGVCWQPCRDSRGPGRRRHSAGGGGPPGPVAGRCRRWVGGGAAAIPPPRGTAAAAAPRPAPERLPPRWPTARSAARPAGAPAPRAARSGPGPACHIPGPHVTCTRPQGSGCSWVKRTVRSYLLDLCEANRAGWHRRRRSHL